MTFTKSRDTQARAVHNGNFTIGARQALGSNFHFRLDGYFTFSGYYSYYVASSYVAGGGFIAT